MNPAFLTFLCFQGYMKSHFVGSLDFLKLKLPLGLI